MDSCGSPRQGLRHPNKGAFGVSQISPTGSFGKRLPTLLILIVLAGCLHGCVPTMRYGSPPKTERLQALRVNESTSSDVLSALGQPRGRGEVRLNEHVEPRDIWFYEYTEVDGTRVNLKMLMVYLHKGVYEGHLWFASSGLMPRAE